MRPISSPLSLAGGMVMLAATMLSVAFSVSSRASEQGSPEPGGYSLAPGGGVPLSMGNFRIPIRTSGTPGSPGPVALHAGIPFPKGWMKEPGKVAVVDEMGSAVASASRVMGRWPESDSIRWLGVDFVGDPAKEYFVVPLAARSGAPEVKRGVEVQSDSDTFVVTTGLARFVLPKKGALISRIFFDRNGDRRFEGAELVIENKKGDDLYLVDSGGRLGTVGGDGEENQLRYENESEERRKDEPVVRAVFRREGWYVTDKGERLGRHITRLIFHAGEAEAKVEHAFIVTEDTNQLWFRDYGMRLVYAPGARPDRVVAPKKEKEDTPSLEIAFGANDREVFLFQEKAFYFSRMDPVKDCRFEIAKISSAGKAETLESGSLAGNWMLAANRNGSVGIALRNFWQTFPKEIATTHEAMTLKLWSPRAGMEMDFRTETLLERWPKEWFNTNYASGPLRKRIGKIDGNAIGFSRSHDFVISVAGDADPKTMARRAARAQNPEVCLADPAWLRFTEAMGKFHPYDPARFPDEEALMETWFDQSMEIYRQWGDYGFFDFGSWPHVWFRQGVKGPLKGRWYPYVDRYPGSLDYGFHANVWRSFARSGKRKYFDAAEEVTRQRMDMTMAHWDQLDPSETFSKKKMPRRLLGAYTSSSTPIYWGGNTSFHQQSGTDIRALAYWYYLTDHRRAKEMIDHYADAVKRVWNTGHLGAFRGSRPFATLKNLATVYQETGDPELKPIVQAQVEWLADLDAPQGVSREREATGLAKYGVKAGAMHRVHEVMADPLAAKVLLKGATTRASTSLGEPPFSYFNIEGELFSEAAALTGDPMFVRAMRRDMAVAVSEYRDPKTGEWLRIWRGVGPSPSSNVYPLGGMAFAMDAIVRDEREHGRKDDLPPHARQCGFGRPVLAVFEKPAGKSVYLDIRSNRVLAPVVYDASGIPVSGVEMKPSEDQLYSLVKAATRWELVFPKELPSGAYFIDSGGGGALWEVTWTDAPKVALHAPAGFVLGPGGRQWGNRIMQGDRDRQASAYFHLPQGSERFEIFASSPGELRLPDGTTLAIGADEGGWQTIEAGEANRGKTWEIFSPSVSFIELRGIPSFIGYGSPDRLFVPEIAADALARLPASLPPAGAPFALPGSDLPFFTTPSSPGEPGHGLLLAGKHRLEIPLDPGSAGGSAPLMSRGEGTVEFWLMPRWSSVYQFGQSGRVRTVMNAGPWRLSLHRYGEMSITASVEGDPANSGEAPSSLETNSGVTLEQGAWTHFALQWRESDGEFTLELFVNGKKQRFGIDRAGMPANEKGFVAASPGPELSFGGARGSQQDLDAILAGLRFSHAARYHTDFDPAHSSTLAADASTAGLYLFDGNLIGSGPSGESVPPARLLNP